MSGFYEWIRNIIFYLLLVSLLNQLLPEGSYRKYMRVSAGLILLIVAVWPLLKFSGSLPQLSYFFDLEGLKIENQGFLTQAAFAQEERMQMVTRQYRQNIEKQVFRIFDDSSLYAVSVTVDMNEDTESDAYGKINEIDVTVVLNPDEVGAAAASEKTEKVKIETVEIQKIGDGDLEEKTVKKNESASVSDEREMDDSEVEKKRMVDILAAYFGIDSSQVIIRRADE